MKKGEKAQNNLSEKQNPQSREWCVEPKSFEPLKFKGWGQEPPTGEDDIQNPLFV